MANLMKAFENCKWVEFEAWLDAHHDLLINHHEADAPDSSVRSVPSLVQRKPPVRGRNVSDEATLSASSPKSDPHGKK